MSNDKQTAVEWLVSQQKHNQFFDIETIEIAKEMEKEQHSITWENTKSAMEVYKWESFQQYFNKTYGGDK